jgi:hypothetical protein
MWKIKQALHLLWFMLVWLHLDNNVPKKNAN